MACSDDDDAMTPVACLPPATQTGENTFGCLINGKPWVAEIEPGVISASLRSLDMNYDETGFGDFYDNKWRMDANLIWEDSTNEFFIFKARYLTSITRLTHNANNIEIIFNTDRNNFNWYYLDTILPYQISILELDTLRNICSGTFNFYALSSDQSDTLHITEGRFDKRYSPE